MPARWNLECPTHGTEWDVVCSMRALPPCPVCGAERRIDPTHVTPKSAVFPFEARHVAPDGKPMIIESMSQLRRIEKQLGVVFSAFNNNENNSVDPTCKDLPRYRGEDADYQHDHRKR